MLELKDVKKYYRGTGEVVHAVDGAYLSVKEGEFTAIFGPSGSGKTTLLLLAAGLLSPDAGTVSFRGKDIGHLADGEVRRYLREEVGFIFQTFNLFPGLTAVNNVAAPLLFGRCDHIKAEGIAHEKLELVGMENRATHKPGQLSGGEQQRVAIARALVGSPSLILADEPTGNLDTKRGGEVLSLLSGIVSSDSVAVVLVTHDARAAEHASQTHEMRDGRLLDGLSQATIS